MLFVVFFFDVTFTYIYTLRFIRLIYMLLLLPFRVIVFLIFPEKIDDLRAFAGEFLGTLLLPFVHAVGLFAFFLLWNNSGLMKLSPTAELLTIIFSMAALLKFGSEASRLLGSFFSGAGALSRSGEQFAGGMAQLAGQIAGGVAGGIAGGALSLGSRLKVLGARAPGGGPGGGGSASPGPAEAAVRPIFPEAGRTCRRRTVPRRRILPPAEDRAPVPADLVWDPLVRGNPEEPEAARPATLHRPAGRRRRSVPIRTARPGRHPRRPRLPVREMRRPVPPGRIGHLPFPAGSGGGPSAGTPGGGPAMIEGNGPPPSGGNAGTAPAGGMKIDGMTVGSGESDRPAGGVTDLPGGGRTAGGGSGGVLPAIDRVVDRVRAGAAAALPAIVPIAQTFAHVMTTATITGDVPNMAGLLKDYRYEQERKRRQRMRRDGEGRPDDASRPRFDRSSGQDRGRLL